MLMLNVVNGEKEEDDATRAPESGDKQPEFFFTVNNVQH